ncbi:replication initiation protein [Intestinimonas sp. MSJ-38]|uniref:replication initiation protein n=1 Tax=Intestinimonas sp. MSJ-38 TaxID=2841532 RepID=UPI001C0FE32E|nr:replication initiation protein [Intestinimonas sp. MSJ-38]MBU5433932.1 replication initiation protein [Intestinimonas sp. MSJ-38]
MPRKKKEPLAGIGRDPETKLIVQKSKPLFELWRSNLSLAEFKIMDMYLARIDTHKPEQRTIKLTKGQLEQALGVTRINQPDLEHRLKNLYQPIDLAKGDRKRLHLVSLFEEAIADQDDDGVWQITLTCTNAAMKYFFHFEKLGYFRYKLRCITSLTSRYTYVLFMYLESNRFRKEWEVSLDELKKILNCDGDTSYNEYKIFNQRILKRCQKELLDKTECRFEYKPIKSGRRVTAIRFTLESISKLIDDPLSGQMPGQISFTDLPSNHGTDLIELLRSATTPPGSDEPEFSRAEIEHLFTTLATVSVDKLPQIDDNNIDLRRYHYLAEKYAAMNRQAEKQQIKHRFAYLLKLIV